MENPTPFRQRRRILLIDHKPQLSLILYALASATVSAIFVFQATAHWYRAQWEGFEYRPWLVAGTGFALLVLIVLCGFYITNRCFGPLFQMRRQIKLALQGERAKIHVRRGDHFAPLMEDVNALFDKLQTQDKK